VELSIHERLKDLRVERGLTLEQLAEQTHLSKSALGSYEAEDFKDISHYALIKLAKFYGVTVDYLLGVAETKSHPNALSAPPLTASPVFANG
jgi:transcriptional regulator with XRE-family HTH domain